MPDSYSERRGFDSRRTDDSFFGIVQSVGHEPLKLVIQVRALVPKPRPDTCARRGTCVPWSLTISREKAEAVAPKPSPFSDLAQLDEHLPVTQRDLRSNRRV